MRTKVIEKLKQHFLEDGGFDEDYEEFIGFPVPQSEDEIDMLSDDQLIELLSIYGAFLG